MARKGNPRSVGKTDQEMGQRIRLRRVEMEMTQRELASAAGISFQQLQKYEKGANRVGAVRLERVAAVLDVPITFFYDRGKANQKQEEVKACSF